MFSCDFQVSCAALDLLERRKRKKIDGSEQIRREDAVKLRALKKLLGVCRSASAVKMSAG